MKKIVVFIALFTILIACKQEHLSPDRFKHGTFEIPAGKGFEKEVIIRKDSIQISQYGDQIDTLLIVWKDNFNYTLTYLNPKSALDEEPLHIKITNIENDSYDFESTVGNSNYIQKGTITKIAD
jgi:hypothetical protein